MNAYIINLLFTFLLFNTAFGQITHKKGTPISWSLKSEPQDISTYHLPKMDNLQLRLEDEAQQTNKPSPYTFATPYNVDLNPQNSGTWTELSSGDKLWRLQMESAGALNLNIIFSSYKLAPGEEVFIYSTDRTQVIGPFTHLNNKKSGNLPTIPLDADKIMVEYFVPQNSQNSGSLTIGQINHGFRPLGVRDFGDSQPCHNNVICEEWTDWTCHTQAVATLMVGGKSFCTGTLVNNTAQDGRPLLITAAHCLGDEEIEEDVSTWSFVFKWISPSCDPSENASKEHAIAGATLVNHYFNADFALLELSENPPTDWGLYYSGWDATGDIPNSVVGIHHPVGDIMKISLDQDPLVMNNERTDDNWEVTWDDGSTEGNSSGSAIFDQNFRQVGHLTGGGASCSNMGTPDYYGSLYAAWNLGASEFLDPEGTGKKVLDGKGVGECAGEDTTEVSVETYTYSQPEMNYSNKAGLLKLQVYQTTRFQIYDVEGKIVLQNTLEAGDHNIDLKALSNGLYTVKSDASPTQGKLIVVNK